LDGRSVLDGRKGVRNDSFPSAEHGFSVYFGRVCPVTWFTGTGLGDLFRELGDLTLAFLRSDVTA
jgi:hypothetical protein